MNLQKSALGPAVLALALGITGMSAAQPTAGETEAPRAGRQGKRNRAGRAQRNAARAVVPSPQVLEKALGKPLTDEQRKTIADAARTYMENVARAVGLTPDELKAQMQEYRARQRATRRQGGGPTAGAAGQDGAGNGAAKNQEDDEN